MKAVENRLLLIAKLGSESVFGQEHLLYQTVRL